MGEGHVGHSQNDSSSGGMILNDSFFRKWAGIGGAEDVPMLHRQSVNPADGL